MNQKLIEVKNLKTYFYTEAGTIKAVDNVSFDIYKGEVLGIVGESGSGKSVTSLSINRLIPNPPGEIVSGQVLYNKQNLLDLSYNEMRNIRGKDIAMIFQEPMTSLNPVLKIEAQMNEVLIKHEGLSKKEATMRSIQMLEAVGIPEPNKRINEYPHQFSGGMRQRVMIAMALQCNPSLLIADEPTTALDVTIQAQILDLMGKLKTELGMSILFITHDLGLVQEFSDQVCVMKNGEIVEQGDTNEVFTNPSHAYTKKLLDAEPQPKPIEDLDSNPVIEINNLNVFYNTPSANPFKKERFHAVKDISLNIYKNTTIGLVGESGSGKSTLGRAIASLIPYEGDISYEGKNLKSNSSKEAKDLKKHVQIVFQDPYGSLSPRMTIGEIVGEGLGVHFKLTSNERDQRIDKVLSDVGIESSAKNKYPHEFSGGQRQRVAIARSLIMNPAFMILDEPTSALDRSIQIQVIDLLKDIQNEYGLTYLFISHDLKVIRSMSDFIFVMKNGMIVESGLSHQVFDNPKEEYTKKLLSAALRYASN